MLNGHGSFGSVALLLMRKYGRQAPWFIQHVLMDKKTWREPLGGVSWIWWHFVPGPEGLELAIQNGEDSEHSFEYPEVTPQSLATSKPLEEMLTLGIQPYQSILSHWSESLHHDHLDNPDYSISTEIVYVEPYWSDQFWLPITTNEFGTLGRFRRMVVA